MPDDKFKFGQLKERITVLREELPIKLAGQANKYFVKSFDTQSWEGKAWKEVKRRIPGTPEYKYPLKKDIGRRTRPILVGKGSTKLRRAVNNAARNGVANWPIVKLIVDLPYAKAHNEGLENMPKRTFMGHTNELTKMHKDTINKAMKGLWYK